MTILNQFIRVGCFVFQNKKSIIVEQIQKYKKITSQDGEDGIIEAIFDKLEITKGWCVEFGAWDGKHLSNTWNLWFNKGWNAVLIEGDQKRVKQLEENISEYPNVECLNCFVSYEGKNKLDNLLLRVDIPKEFDLLSIDVDGDDYHIWKALVKYFPKVVIIEYNPTIMPGIDLIDLQGERNFGSSALALTNLAAEKGYCLIGCTSTNMVFVKNELTHKLGFPRISLNEVFDKRHLIQVINAFSGRAFLTRNNPYCSTNTIRGILLQLLPVSIPEHNQENLQHVVIIDHSFLKKIFPPLIPCLTIVRAIKKTAKKIFLR